MKTNLIMRQVEKRTRTTNEELLYELSEKLELLIWEFGVETWKVTQTSPKTGEKELTVYNLHIEIAEDSDGTFIMFFDMQKKIMNNNSILMMFMPEQIKKVNIFKNEVGYDAFKFEFLKGTKVTIEALPGVYAPYEDYDETMVRIA